MQFVVEEGDILPVVAIISYSGVKCSLDCRRWPAPYHFVTAVAPPSVPSHEFVFVFFLYMGIFTLARLVD